MGLQSRSSPHVLTTIFTPSLYPSILFPSTIEISQISQHSQNQIIIKNHKNKYVTIITQNQPNCRIIVHFPAYAHDHE
jgi:hypothetical protein